MILYSIERNAREHFFYTFDLPKWEMGDQADGKHVNIA